MRARLGELWATRRAEIVLALALASAAVAWIATSSAAVAFGLSTLVFAADAIMRAGRRRLTDQADGRLSGAQQARAEEIRRLEEEAEAAEETEALAALDLRLEAMRERVRRSVDAEARERARSGDE